MTLEQFLYRRHSSPNITYLIDLLILLMLPALCLSLIRSHIAESGTLAIAIAYLTTLRILARHSAYKNQQRELAILRQEELSVEIRNDTLTFKHRLPDTNFTVLGKTYPQFQQEYVEFDQKESEQLYQLLKASPSNKEREMANVIALAPLI